MTNIYDTGINIARALRSAIMNSPVGEKITDCYPLYMDSAILPYVVYGCEGMTTTEFKGNATYTDTLQMSVICYAASYDESLLIAEGVREALSSSERPTFLRHVKLMNRREMYTADAFVQYLTFEIKTPLIQNN